MNLPGIGADQRQPTRTWTVSLLPLDRLPRFNPGMNAPAFVQNSEWVIHVDRGQLYVALHGMLHELHGTAYDSDHDAYRAAYGAGLLGVVVYEDTAAGYGFPDGS